MPEGRLQRTRDAYRRTDQRGFTVEIEGETYTVGARVDFSGKSYDHDFSAQYRVGDTISVRPPARYR